MSLGAGHALDASFLVLNKFYMAVHVVSVRRAFCLLFKDLAEVITIDDGRYTSFDFASWREVSQARCCTAIPTTTSSAPFISRSRFRGSSGSFRTTDFPVKESSSIAGICLRVTATVASTAARSSRPTRSASTTWCHGAVADWQHGTILSVPACGATSEKGDERPAKPE